MLQADRPDRKHPLEGEACACKNTKLKQKHRGPLSGDWISKGLSATLGKKSVWAGNSAGTRGNGSHATPATNAEGFSVPDQPEGRFWLQLIRRRNQVGGRVADLVGGTETVALPFFIPPPSMLLDLRALRPGPWTAPLQGFRSERALSSNHIFRRSGQLQRLTVHHQG